MRSMSEGARLDATRWAAVQAAFDRMIELPPSDRLSHLAQLHDADPDLGRWVTALLDGDEHVGDRLGLLELALGTSGDVSADAGAEHGTPDSLGLIGRTVAHFRITDLLGAGGMGLVYRAEDLRLRRTVALKFLLPRYSLDPAATERFLLEARAAAALDHPNICTVHEGGESEDGWLYLAMACYSGETLQARLARVGSLPIKQAVDIVSQIARGLACAHGAGLVHRDLKPANLMLAEDGTVRILDFGLAKARDGNLTGPGMRLGTVAYMSPEQLRGEPVDARIDLWSLGVVFVEMLTGQHPFRGDLAAALLTRRTPVRDVRTLQPPMPVAVGRVVDRLLNKNVAERYQTAADLLAALKSLEGLDTASLRSIARSPRHTRVRAAGIIALLVLGAGAFLLWRHVSDPLAGRAVASARPLHQQYSVAVLPLKNYAGDTTQEYFADGMTDELTTTLSKIEALRVIAHRSVLQFKHSDRSVPEIARLLGVHHVLDGAVMQDGNRVRITVTLIDAARNTPVWSERFERERRDVLTLQHEVALAIAQAIQIALTPQDQARLDHVPEVDPEAFAQYLRGTQARYGGASGGDFGKAVGYFERAIAKDSGYASAHAGLAFVHVLAGDEAPARLHAEKALALDPKLAEAHVVLGLIRQVYDWNWVGSESAFREAIRLNPGYAEAHHELSMLLMRRRRFDEAMREAQRTLYLAPMSARFESGAGEIQLAAGRYDEVLRAAERALALDPTYVGPYYLRVHAYIYQGKHEKALQAITECNAHGFDARPELGYLYAITGRRDKAWSVADTLKTLWRERRRAGGANADALAIGIATVLVGLGERDQALDWLNRGVTSGTRILYLGINPYFRSLHDEPSFRAMLKRVGLDE